MRKLNYITNQEEVKKVSKVYTKEEIKNHKDINVREIFKDIDFLIEVSDIKTIIKNSVLEKELAKIQGMKILFEELNDTHLREQALNEIDELEETSDREILNRNMVMNLKRRGLKFSGQDSIYFKNAEDMSYNEVKSYYLNVAMSYQFNRDFKAIANALKKSIASAKQDFTIFKAIEIGRDSRRKYAIIFNDLVYNNERFGKEISNLFLPYLSLVSCEIAMVNVEQMDGWEKSSYPLINLNDKRVLNIQGNW